MGQPGRTRQRPRDAGATLTRLRRAAVRYLLIALVVCAVCGVVGAFWVRVLGDELERSIVRSWPEAAAQTDLPIFAPSSLPAGSGTPEISAFEAGSAVKLVEAVYPGGLQVVQTNGRTTPSSRAEPVQVRGADEAEWVTENGGRSLLLRRDKTWIGLSGLSDDRELVRVGESLAPVGE